MPRSLLIFVLGLFLPSCGNDKKYEELNKYWWIYENARSVGDDATAVNAIYEIMYLDSNEYIYHDSIAALYYNMGQYQKCVKSAKKSLNYHTYVPTVRYGFEAAKGLNKADEVVLFGEFLLEEDPTNIAVLYDMAVYNLTGENYLEAKNRIDLILANPNAVIAVKEQVQNDGTAVAVPISVCATNLAGVYYWKVGQPDLAEKMFKQALVNFPGYDVAKDNLAALSQRN